MAVAFDKSVSGEMFAAGFHAASVQTFLQGKGKLGHGVGISVEAAVADDGACSPIKVEDGCEGEVYAAGGQLRRQYPADLLGFFFGGGFAFGIPICLRCSWRAVG